MSQRILRIALEVEHHGRILARFAEAAPVPDGELLRDAAKQIAERAVKEITEDDHAA